MQELIWIVNISFSVFMIGLFVWDFRTFGEPTHKDFKAIIMSSGVLGTFVGIFIGLMGFNTSMLQDSVPLLLDGLKTAFYTSILGMGLAIALSIIQRINGAKSTQELNMDYLITQMGNLGQLSNLSLILKQLENAPSKNDMININSTTNAILETSLKKIDISLQEAIKQLALGASKELIGALELVIRDFNNNLQDQFGENFKELNIAVGKLLSWQEQYQVTITKTQDLLAQTQLSLNQTNEAMSSTQTTLDSITRQNANALEFYTKTIDLIENLQSNGEILSAKLEEVSNLGQNATMALDNMDIFFTKATRGLNELESNARDAAHELKMLLDIHLNDLDEHTAQHSLTLKSFLEEISANTQSSLLQSMQEHSSLVRESMENASLDLLDLIKQNASSCAQIIGDLGSLLENNINQTTQFSKLSAEEFSKLKEQILNNHNSISNSIESSLDSLNSHNQNMLDEMNKSVKNMQESYLSTLSKSVDSLMGQEKQVLDSRLLALNEMAKASDANLNAQYEKTNEFMKKLATQYAQILQKLSKDSLALPKEMGEKVMSDFGELQHNLISHLGNLNAQIQHNSLQLIELYRNVQNILNENIAGNKNLQQEIKSTFESLDSAMSASMENFKDSYEWFLRRVREIIGQR